MALALALALAVAPGSGGQLAAQTFPTTKIKDAGPDANRVNFVILAEGYRNVDAPLFLTDATSITTETFTESPLSNYAAFFNVYAVAVASQEAGAKHPGTATDVTEPASPVSTANNYFGTTFDYNGIHRLLYSNQFATINAVAAANYPGYDQLLLLVNDATYGGAGGSYATTSTNPAAGQIAIHEYGHSFAQLADEYAYGRARGGAPNLTAESNPTLVRWADWLGTGGIGVYPVETFAGTTWHRPHQNCMMRYLNRDFCAVCGERLIDVIYGLVGPLDARSPSGTNVTYTGAPVTFEVTTVRPVPNTLAVTWLLDGAVVASGTDAFTFTSAQASSPTHTLVARVTDTTRLSRSYAPAASGYAFETSWAISNAAPLPVTWAAFEVEARDRANVLTWTTGSEQGARAFRVERRRELEDAWAPLGEVPARGRAGAGADYTFVDEAGDHPGLSYYRVVERATDGAETPSEARAVSRITRWFYRLFPNPTSGPLGLEVFTDREAALEIRVFDATGRPVGEQRLRLAPGSHRETLEVGVLPTGVYTVELSRDGGHWRESTRVIVD